MLQTEYAVDRGGGGGGTAAGNDLSWYLSRILWFKVQRKLLQVVVLAVLEPVGGELAVDKQMSQSRQVYQQIAKDVHVPLSIRIAVDYRSWVTKCLCCLRKPVLPSISLLISFQLARIREKQ